MVILSYIAAILFAINNFYLGLLIGDALVFYTNKFWGWKYYNVPEPIPVWKWFTLLVFFLPTFFFGLFFYALLVLIGLSLVMLLLIHILQLTLMRNK